eukprot:gene2617-3008_t
MNVDLTFPVVPTASALTELVSMVLSAVLATTSFESTAVSAATTTAPSTQFETSRNDTANSQVMPVTKMRFVHNTLEPMHHMHQETTTAHCTALNMDMHQFVPTTAETSLEVDNHTSCVFGVSARQLTTSLCLLGDRVGRGSEGSERFEEHGPSTISSSSSWLSTSSPCCPPRSDPHFDRGCFIILKASKKICLNCVQHRVNNKKHFKKDLIQYVYSYIQKRDLQNYKLQLQQQHSVESLRPCLSTGAFTALSWRPLDNQQPIELPVETPSTSLVVVTDCADASANYTAIQEEDENTFFEWFSDFSLMDDTCEATCEANPTMQASVIPFRSVQQFLDATESTDYECASACTKTHTFNRPSATPRLIIKPTWCVYGNSLNTEFFYNCLFDQECGDIIVDHFEPIVQSPELFILSKGGRRILETPNAGGNSVWSEVLSFEVLNQVFGATLCKTETEIQYAPGSKITDYSVEFQGHHIGVSVVRIINFFDLMGKTYKAVFTPEYARELLYKKLFGVIASSLAVVDKWEKQILYIWTTSSRSADIIVEEYWKVPKKLRSNTLVYVTHATGSEWLF